MAIPSRKSFYYPCLASLIMAKTVMGSLLLSTPAMAIFDVLEGQESIPIEVEPYSGPTLPIESGTEPVQLNLPDNLPSPVEPEPAVAQPTPSPAPSIPNTDEPAPVESGSATASVAFPAAGIRLQPPADFTPATLFDGFEQEETQASIMVLSLPAPTEEMLPAFSNEERLRQENMRLISKEAINISGQPGLLVQLEQETRGLTFGKWILIFGPDSPNSNKTTIINANFPQELAAQLSAPIKASLLTTQVDDSLSAAQTEDSSSFSITPTNDLALALNLSGTLLYSQGGEMRSNNPGAPLFIVSPSFSDVIVQDRGKFSRDRLQQSDQIKDITILRERPITIDNIKGYEISATAKDSKTNTSLLVYQTILFAEDRYYIMQGLVGEDTGNSYLADFKTMAESFQRK